jgi:hypothetical protein
VICTIVVEYNLNSRYQPSTEGTTVLPSIPFGTTVSTDGWYRVGYDGQSGWVSGDNVTPSASCHALPILDATE